MSTYGHSYHRKKRKINFRLILAIIALLSAISTVGFFTKNFLTERKIKEYASSISVLKRETQELKDKLPILDEDIKQLEKEAESLQDMINHLKPVVIPESMK